jgi:hypothetical protein
MKKNTIFWMASAFLFMGMVIGFLISPIKKGMGSHSGNSYKIDKYIKSAKEYTTSRMTKFLAI